MLAAESRHIVGCPDGKHDIWWWSFRSSRAVSAGSWCQRRDRPTDCRCRVGL